MWEIILVSVTAFIAGAFICALFFYRQLFKEKEKNILLDKENSSLKSELKVIKQAKENEDSLFNVIKKEFSSYANEILIEKQKNLQEQNKTSLENFLNPLKEKIKEFQTRVETYNETGKVNTATLKEKIEELIKQSQITVNKTEKLSEAITQNSKFRGSMGEMVLDKILKSSGLIDKKDNPKGNYETQVSFKTNDNGSTKIVDAIIYLSEGQKSVVVDSKAPLSNFMNFLETEDETKKAQCLQDFMSDVSNRVKELSNKYTDLKDTYTPDFTLMFIPFEYPLTFIYANNKLIEEALRQNVIISGPSTLIATLRTINYSWAQKNQYDNIKEISKLGYSIYEKCIILIQKIESVQTSFETVRKNFESLFTTIRGRGGLVGQVEKLKEYGISPAKQIDEKYILENETPAALK